MKEDSPLGQQETIHPKDLWDKDLILSQQASDGGILQTWLKKEISELNVTATYTLVMNAMKMVSGGMGYAMVIDGLVNTKESGLVFRPLKPALNGEMYLIWKKYQVFTPTAEAFLDEIGRRFKSE